MSDKNTILDAKLKRAIISILKACNVHTASVTVRNLEKKQPEQNHFKLPKLEHHTSWTHSKAVGYTVSEDDDTVFLIASITKALVAVAVTIAVEVKAKGPNKDNRYTKFSTADKDSLTELYNKHKEGSLKEMKDLPGNPGIFQLLRHFKGFPSSNHRLLGPDGSPLMTVGSFLADLQGFSDRVPAGKHLEDSWTSYSNINYSLVGIVVETLWGGTLSDFMRETLFDPLEMNATTIGYDKSKIPQAGRYVVDSNGDIHSANTPDYISTGPESAALGAYSSAKDLERFFTFLFKAFHDEEIIKGVGIDLVNELLKCGTKQTERNVYTALGLFTTLDSSIIGSMSTNRSLFPKKEFSTYAVVPKLAKESIEAYYMAGSAIGCSSACAFLPGGEKNNFAVIVLTNTSGPVDAGDHVLRLILQRIASMIQPKTLIGLIRRPKDVEKMVEKAWSASSGAFRNLEAIDKGLIMEAPNTPSDIVGTYKGRGFSQSLEIKKTNEGTEVTFAGSADPKPLQLVWINPETVKICILPHRSIDRLGTGDWSDLKFKVHVTNNSVTVLERRTAIGVDFFDRHMEQS